MTQSIAIEDILPLNPGQSLFFHAALGSRVETMNLQQYSYYLDGDIEADKAHAALQAMVDAQPGLRTSIHHRSLSQPFQVIHKKAVLPFRYEDMRTLPDDKRDSAILSHLQQDAAMPFNWHRPPLMRAFLHRITDTRSLLTITIDHVIFDGWSLGSAMGEFLAAYKMLRAGEEAVLEPAPSVRGYMHWYKQQDNSGALQWYREQLGGAGPQPLPYGNPEADPSDVAANSITALFFTPEEDRQLTEGAKRMGVTPNIIFQGAWALALAQCRQDSNAYFLSIIASRPTAVPGIEKMFNPLMGIIPYRLSCANGLKTGSWLKDMYAYQIEAMEYHHVPPLEILGVRPELPPVTLSSALVFQNMETGETKNEQEQTKEDIALSGARMHSNLGYAVVIMAFPFPVFHLSVIYDARIIVEKDMEKIVALLRSLMLLIAQGEDVTLGEIRNRAGMDGLSMVKEPCDFPEKAAGEQI